MHRRRPLLLVAVVALIVQQPPAADAQQPDLLQVLRHEFIDIRPGEGKFPAKFRMGNVEEPSSRPAHDVAIRQEFSIAKYEVPQDLWTKVMGSNPSRWKGPRNSVEEVSFDDAVAFCERVTLLLRAAMLIEPNQMIRLPTEAEWEYAARAGSESRFSFGDRADQLGEFAWFTGNARGNDPPVGAKRPNPWGLYDMHGYLWEWCSDAWHANYEGAPVDGSAWLHQPDNNSAVIRGGSWKDPASSLSSSFRMGAPRTKSDDAIGLRCVLANPL